MSGLPDDTRGIVDPVAMMRFVDFERFAAGQELDGVIEWFWSVRWDLPAGVTHDQQVLNHPAGNLSVGTIDDTGVPLDPAEGRLYGVLTGLSSRHLTGQGWTVAARTTVGGLGVVMDAPARSATDRQLSLAESVPGLPNEVVAEVAALGSAADRVHALRYGLEVAISQRDPSAIAEARAVVAVAAAAEHDRTVCRIEDLARVAGVSPRTLQRSFEHHVGISPAAVIRRWRIIEAAESARSAIDAGETWGGWAAVAAELGYADQAHLTRDFRRHLGTTPAAYLAAAASER